MVKYQFVEEYKPIHLMPPKSPKSINIKILSKFEDLDPKYQKWCLSLETQRHYTYTKFGKTSRENTEGIKRQLEIRNTELDMIELMKRKKVNVYRRCMNELNEKFAQQKAKLEN